MDFPFAPTRFGASATETRMGSATQVGRKAGSPCNGDSIAASVCPLTDRSLYKIDHFPTVHRGIGGRRHKRIVGQRGAIRPVRRPTRLRNHRTTSGSTTPQSPLL